ncbi:MAG: pantoate--beta-alanine ligase [Pirellulales bacterium]
MKILVNPIEAFAEIAQVRNSGAKIGLIPTMGALHEGHLTLAKRSKAECDYTVVTIFVNPTQFAPNEDFSRYPRTLEADLAGLRSLGVDAVFTPTQDDLYPKRFSTYIDPPAEAQPLEGVCRPGHFRGVATIVMKLFQILPATVAYFGQKDYQQLTIIRRMVEDLNVPIRIQGCPTVRESDGLAMSSRNRYLSAEQRQRALCLWRALSKAKELFESGERRVAEIEAHMSKELTEGGADSIEYARVVDADSLASYQESIDTPSVALIAARVGQTRLIDNLLLEAPTS